jgi:hypothetical protein
VSDSPNYAREPRWRADGKELFYLDYRDMANTAIGKVRLMAVSIGEGSNPVSVPTVLFECKPAIGTVPQGNIFLYSPSPDGQRFLIDMDIAAAKPTLEVILNLSGAAK